MTSELETLLDQYELTDQEQEIERIFEQADHYMINKKDFNRAHSLYKQIISMDANNIDAYNSLAQWIQNMSKPWLLFLFSMSINSCNNKETSNLTWFVI